MNKTQLQTNNSRLASLIDELKGKAAGGGGAVDTCTVEILPQINPATYLSYSSLTSNGKISSGLNGFASPGGGASFECVCGTILCFYMMGLQSITTNNAEVLINNSGFVAVAITAESGGTATITPIGADLTGGSGAM